MLDDLSSYLVYILAFLFVLALILVVAWLFKSLTGGRGSNGGSGLFGGRDKRIGVVQAASVDGRRKLILIRRDDKEHLIMVGGPVDMLIENGIESPAGQAFGASRREPDQLSGHRSPREPLTGYSELDDPKTDPGDIRPTAADRADLRPGQEKTDDARREDNPKRRLSLTTRSEQTKGDGEP